MTIGLRKIELAHVSELDHLPCPLEVALRYTDLRREDIHCSHGEDAQGGAGFCHAIDHLVHGAVSTGGDYGLEALSRSLSSQAAGVPRSCGEANDRMTRQGLDFAPQFARSVAAGGGIKNN